jgi:hypothetical protein
MVSLGDQKVSFKKDEVLVLLGAGASVDAGIPHSAQMVQHIEDALKSEWQQYRELYNYVRSAIFYADGIRGTFQVAYNIERLVVSLDELARREEHPLYPFIGAWNPRLTQVAGPAFENVSEFRRKILDKLRHEWVEIANYEKAGYYTGLIRFQKELNYPLRVFSLNYDLCVEKAYQVEYYEFPERGFDKADRCWTHSLFEEASPAEKNLYLYKLHGSIDWMWESETGRLTFSDSSSTIKVEDGALIFGTSYKLQYVDPFLFLVYQLRRFSLEAKLILVIGYGFCDEHINGILHQALRASPEKRLVAVMMENNVSASDKDKAIERCKRFVIDQLKMEQHDDRINIIWDSARDFLEEQLSLAAMSGYFPLEQEIFEDISAEVTPTSEKMSAREPAAGGE